MSDMQILIIANGIGVICAVLLAIAGQQKKQTRFLFIQIVANVLFAIQYLMLDAVTAAVMAGVAIVRMWIFFLYKRESREVPIWILLALMIVTLGLGIWMWDGALSVIPMIAGIVITYGQWHKKMDVTRKTTLIGEACWFIYNWYYSVFANVGIGIVIISSVLIAMARDRKEGLITNDTI